MKEVNIKKQYPFQYYTIRNVDLLEQNGFNFDDYSFNKKHKHELYIGNINGLICRHSYGMPIKLAKYLLVNDDNKLTFLLPENYRECVNDLRGLRKSVTDYFDAESLKNRITVITYKVDNSDIIDKVAELGKSMKFDICVMNPPYDNSLHLQILEKVVNFTDRIVNISPVRWLQDPFARYKKNSDYIKFENSVSKRISSLEVVENCNDLFDIDFACNLAIYILDKNGGFDYQKFNANRLVEKFVSKCYTSIADISTEEGYRGKYKSKYFGIVNSHYGDYSRWINEKFDLFIRLRETNTNKVIFFENESQIRNCFDYLNSKVMRGYAKLSRTNQRVPWQFVSVVDFNKHWTELELCEYFDITGYISDTEAEPGSEWETILNTISH